MKELKELTVQTAAIDTLIICAVVFFSAIILGSEPLRWILMASLMMAVIELLTTSVHTIGCHTREYLYFNGFMAVILLLAVCLVFVKHLTWQQYVLCLGLVMASDAGGLFFGRLFGKKRPFFSKNLSPNKTWVGYLGELITTWTFGWLGLFILGLPLSWPNVVFVCCGFVVCAIGDLIGSGAKRELGIKHSNECLLNVPFLGKIECLMRSRHGFLDCMDSASCALIFYIILQQLGRF